jgi:hypothetical protein
MIPYPTPLEGRGIGDGDNYITLKVNLEVSGETPCPCGTPL